ncbi:hypothetical protein QJU23_03635 [Pasteurella atlantica]|uniref:Uncharacterized protein n=2 Tax=Pasteurellaceae TaxID=712 RepID=A0ACC6HL60_9PAST|nr:hypothetical protein [Pasteurella atlantica]MDP8051518.1 hypothetical protein [Pasteurella atlantica]MDP8104903.1 hypothetical protein [Pasteurella atlantica]MDP8148277.1 hypothetical protein [Pasteurella atlantica]
MNVSSYLEAFLTVYGWETYYVLYLLFASFGIFLYPFMRILIDTFINYATGSEYAGKNHILQLSVLFVLAGLVFLLSVVPFKSIDLSTTTVKSVCASNTDVLKFNSEKYFNNTQTRVPIMPWIAMSLGQGLNSVIYNETPCTLDITETRKAVMAVDLSQAKDPQLLNQEVNRFVSECHMKATGILKSMLNNEYGENVTTTLKDFIRNLENEAIKQTGNSNREKHEKYLLYNYDSPLIKQVFYQNTSPLSTLPETKGLTPLEANTPVNGINGYQDNGSIQQGKATPPSCYDWWENSSNGLKYRMVDAMEKSLAVNVGNDLNISDCQNDYPFYMSDYRKQTCINKIKSDLYQGKGDKLTQEMFRTIQGQGKSDSVLSNSDTGKLGGIAIAGIGSSIASMITGTDLSIGIIGQATTMYMSLFILKLMLKYFIPMILMSIYMFWGLYMVIGEFKGQVMIKGMILIMALTIMPGLWAIVEHLDDSLYSAMYSTTNSDDILKFNMLLLDITTGIFQIAIVFVIFYLIGEAGGGNPRGVTHDSQNSANNFSKNAGNTIGSAASKGIRWATIGQRNSSGTITSGGFGTKLGNGIKGGIRKIRNR